MDLVQVRFKPPAVNAKQAEKHKCPNVRKLLAVQLSTHGAKYDFLQLRQQQIRATQIKATQIRETEISSNHRELHGAIFSIDYQSKMKGNIAPAVALCTASLVLESC